MTRQSPLQRFTGKVEVNPDTRCWEWQGYLNRDGYGKFWDGSQMVLAHRWILEQVAGPLGTDEADHLCENRRCCNPHHLEAVDGIENKLRITDKSRRSTRHIERDLSALSIAS